MKDDRTRGPRVSRRTENVPPARRVDGDGARESAQGRAEGTQGNRPRFASPKGDGAREAKPRFAAPRGEGERSAKPRFATPRGEGERPRFSSSKDGAQGDRPRFSSPKDGAQGDQPRFAAPRDGAQGERPRFAAPKGDEQKERPRYAGYVPGARDADGGRKPRFAQGTDARKPREFSAQEADVRKPREFAPLDSDAQMPREADAAEPEIDLSGDNLLTGRNPIREALRAGTPIDKLIVAEGDLSGAAREIITLAREKGIIVQKVSRQRLDAVYPAHQGMVAYVAQAEYSTIESMLELARERGEAPFLVILDGVTDPHNLGAVIRSAECAGAHGVIIPERRASGLTPAAAKAAAGALSYLKVARVPNLNRAIDDLKREGVWVVAAALEGEDAFSADLTGAIALVVGSEGEGISRLTLEKCDRRVTLPMKGQIGSLNASVAAGILIYEVLRARSRA